VATPDPELLARCLSLLEELQVILDTDPHAFGEGHETSTVRGVVEAWETTNTLADVFLGPGRDAHGLKGRDN
jgi:hypothetical protein